MQADLHEAFRERLRKYFSKTVSRLTTPEEKSRSDEKLWEFVIDYESGGAYQLLIHWIMQSRPYSAEQMGSLFYQLADAGQNVNIPQ